MITHHHLRTLKAKVEHILSEVPKSRDSDVVLTCYLWINFYGEFIKKDKDGVAWLRLRDMPKLPSEDQIGRIRRKVQEEGRFLPTSKEVALQRGISEEVWKDWSINRT